MDIRGRGAVVDDEFGFCIGFDVVFVAVVNFFVFYDPAGIAVFLFAFGAALLKAFGAFSCFDFFILLAGVALARRGDKAGIDDAAFASDDALGGEIFFKVCEEALAAIHAIGFEAMAIVCKFLFRQ